MKVSKLITQLHIQLLQTVWLYFSCSPCFPCPQSHASDTSHCQKWERDARDLLFFRRALCMEIASSTFFPLRMSCQLLQLLNLADVAGSCHTPGSSLQGLVATRRDAPVTRVPLAIVLARSCAFAFLTF